MINMFDPTRDYNNHKEEYTNTINQVLNHGRFINGPEVTELEEKLSNYVNTKHCICVANGTDALQIALMALNIGYGDEVITVAHTWISTAEVISLLGATPVFVDIEYDTYCIDINKVINKITNKTKAIISVSLYGQMPDYDELNKFGIPVIEDGAQSFGAMNKNRRSCSIAKISTTSFFPTKPLGCYGDGGACFTNDDELALKIKSIKNHGALKRFEHNYIGVNSRLDTLQASILLIKLKYFDECLKNRNKVAKYYNNNLNNIEHVILPKTSKNNYHVWAQYSILLENKKIRDRVFNELKENGINVAIFYPSPLHKKKCFDNMASNSLIDNKLSVTEDVCDRIINLPIYAELKKSELACICDIFKNILNNIYE